MQQGSVLADEPSQFEPHRNQPSMMLQLRLSVIVARLELPRLDGRHGLWRARPQARPLPIAQGGSHSARTPHHRPQSRRQSSRSELGGQGLAGSSAVTTERGRRWRARMTGLALKLDQQAQQLCCDAKAGRTAAPSRHGYRPIPGAPLGREVKFPVVLTLVGGER